MLTVSLLVCAMMALATAEDNSTDIMDVLDPTKEPACCPDDEWVENNGRRFLFNPKLMTWTDAEKYCQTKNANLASVHSDDENTFLQGLIHKNNNNDPETWIGGTDCQQNNDWLWSDGSIFNYASWCQGKPNDPCSTQGCLQMNHGTDHCWDDTECSSTRPSICAINL